jgi:serine/threonine-protein kinase
MSGTDPLLGRVIAGKFRVDKTLGSGGMGRVYQAEQTNLGKAIAIKVLHANMAGDPTLEKRFFREAKSASQLSHPNIVQVIDFGDEGGLLFIAMELLAGRDLSQLLRKEFPFPPERVAHIVGQVLGALEEAHEKGIVHRDLKPENVMLLDVRGEDFVKVCDFGIAKATAEREAEGSAITSAGMICGTPEYMSPEQARGEPLDGRSDLYSVASILYQMMCGELPFRAETALGVVAKVLTDPPVPPSQRRANLNIPPALEALILRGLEKNRDKRHASAKEMRNALYDAVGLKRPGASGEMRKPQTHAADVALADTGVDTPVSKPNLVPPETPAPSVPSTSAPQRSRVWMFVAIVVVIAAGTAGLLFGMNKKPAPAPTATVAPVQPPTPPPVVVPEPPPTPQPVPVAAPEPTPPPVVAAPEAPKAGKKHHAPAAPAPPKTVVAAPAPPVKAAEPKLSPFAEAEQLFKAGNIDGALAKYLEAAQKSPNDARTQRQIGKCYNRLGQRDRAQPYFRRYLDLEPEASDAAFIKAMLQ